MAVTNLDHIAATYSQNIVQGREGAKDELETLITNALGVLQENGVYALALYLLSQKKNQELARDAILTNLLNLFTVNSLASLALPAPPAVNNVPAVLSFFSEQVCGDLDKLLLVKSIYEQTLIYARYGAKALEKEQPPKEGETRQEGAAKL